MTYSELELGINGIQIVEPSVLGNFVASLSPDSLLGVEGRLIRGKVFQVNHRMTFQKETHSFALMPGSSVHVKLDIITGKLLPDMLQDCQETICITLDSSDESLLARQRGNPTKQIEPRAVLAGSRDAKALPFLGPATPQARMKAKTGFVLKYDNFFRLQSLQFFLTPVETRGHLSFEPERRHSWPVSGGNPNDASSSVPGGLLASHQNVPSGRLPGSVHPMQPVANQTSGGFLPGLSSGVAAYCRSIQKVAPQALWGSWLGFPPYSPDGSNAPVSRDSARTKRLSIPDAGPPKPAARRRPLCRPTPPGLALPRPIVPAASLPCRSNSMLSCHKHNTNVIILQYLLRLY
jgi:hypothetical protein